MIRLIEPCKAYMTSYTEAYDEYRSFPRRSGNPFRNAHVQDVLAYFDNMRNAGISLRGMSAPPPTGWLTMNRSASWVRSTSATP